MKPRFFSFPLMFLGFFFINLLPLAAQKKTVSFSTLTKGETIHGFTAMSVYLNGSSEAMGGRFVHQRTGFTLDLLQIESVPQVFFWVNTAPVSDNGEPHTQEHLLITKGNKGRDINTREGMSLAQSNAFTSQFHTAYDFNTGAGGEVFYTLFEKYLDALLNPDYTTEEVGREVRNWGVTQNPDSSLRIEEKGSVYNEMSTTMNNPYALMYDSIGRLLYGNTHPLAFNAGGLPAGIRVLNAGDIKKFHNDHYFLGNMGAITSLPASMKVDSVLERMNDILNSLSNSVSHDVQSINKLPAPQPAAKGTISLIPYPSDNAQEPGSFLLAYPASLQLSATEDVLLSNFLSVVAGDATTNLYKLFIDSKTKLPGFDAQSLSAYADDKLGQPVFIELDGIKTENLTEEKAAWVRKQITAELNKIAAYRDGSPELLAFNKRYENSLISLNRYFTKFVNSPPKFGFRNTYDEWYTQIGELNKIQGFQKSVVLKPQFDSVHQLLAGKTNIWKTYLSKWNLTTATPYVVISKANPALIQQAEAERKQRSAAEIARLKSLYNLPDDQQAILHYKAIYDSTTAVLDKLQASQSVKFIDNPPLTLDEELVYKQSKLPGEVPLMSSVFNNMTSATTGIALDLKVVPENKLVYLAILPDLLTQTGIIKNGKPVSYEDMTQMIQQQILSLRSYYSTNMITGRAELIVAGAGNNAAEAQRAVTWINDVLKQPNWQTENLPRIRDFVEQQWSEIRQKMQGAEESWVRDPGNAYYAQNNPLQLATSSFLTRAHNIFRLKWMLKDAGSKADSTAIQKFLSSLANAQTNREQLIKLLSVLTSTSNIIPDSAGSNKIYAEAFSQLPATAKALAKDAAMDLQQILNDIPDNSLADDWKYLCHTLQQDLSQTPAKTLADLNTLRSSLLKTGNARVYMIGSSATEEKLIAAVTQMLGSFDKGPVSKQIYSSARMINDRIKQRMHTTETPVFIGLINPNSPTGVFMNLAPLVSYKDTSKEQLLTLLAAELYAGGGKQSVYTKTIGAGLSYSTGVSTWLGAGLFSYYAERTPELPQTLRYVINEIKHAPVDTTVADYTIAEAIGYVNAAGDYEDRGVGMANALIDGNTPELIRQFRLAVLRLRNDPTLVADIYKYKDSVYEKILPGYGIPSKEIAGGNFFVIGPEKQMIAYEAYLKSAEDKNTKLYRLYPRDFWMVH